MTTDKSTPPIELLKYLPKFLNLLPRPWPGNLESHFGSLNVESWEEWWAGAQHIFVDAAVPRIPVQVISSEEDFRFRDLEAEAEGDQITVVLNLWYSKTEICDELDALIKQRKPDQAAGDSRREWLCEDFVVRAYGQPKALGEIYEVMKYAREGMTDAEIAGKISGAEGGDESDVRRKKEKGKILLRKLAQQVFPVVAEDK